MERKYSKETLPFSDLNDQVVRDALQCQILSKVFSHKLNKKIALKGGFAMRTNHGSQRLTKDIDFEADLSLHTWTIRKLIKESITEALDEGLILNPVVTEPKQTETTLRWKINGKTHDGDPMHVTIEVSRRHHIDPGHLCEKEFNPPSRYGMDTFKVESFDDQAMAGTKVIALISENRVAPRDLFDLDILIRAGVEPPIDILSRMDINQLQNSINELWRKIEIMDWELFSSEVLPFLPYGIKSIDKDLFEEMRIRVGETTEQWLKKTKEKMLA